MFRVMCVCYINNLPITAVCQRCDDQPSRIPEVFVPVLEVCCDHVHMNTVLLLVVPQLTDPIKIIDGGHVQVNQLLNNIACCN